MMASLDDPGQRCTIGSPDSAAQARSAEVGGDLVTGDGQPSMYRGLSAFT
jgi:hypothetical protein